MQTITLGGRVYEILQEGTVRFDFHVESTLRKHRLDQIEKFPGESPDEFSARLFSTIIATGSALDVVALFLYPQGGEWSPEECTRTAAYLGALTSREDKAKIKDLVVQAFIGFFAKGLASAVISRSSLVGVGKKSGSVQPEN